MASAWWLLGLGVIGLVISIYIFSTKAQKKELVCMIGQEHSCNDVVTSKYGKTFGIDNTLGGIGYYGLVVIASITELANPSLFASNLAFWIKVIISGGAVAFSAWLVYVMGVKLKNWCQWCLVSAAASVGILIVVLL